MPLPFTNQWDQNFPADTADVLLGASNLRQLRVDVQQRMAAISGTDATRPNFAADAQPTQWAGILYFATDTAKVYQWNGAFWVDVTTSIGGGGGGGGGGVVFAGDLAGSSASQSVVGLLSRPLPSLGVGYIYWNGSAWMFASGTGTALLDKNTQSITDSNSTAETTIFTTHVPALSPTAVLRITMNFVVDTWANLFHVIWRWNGGQILSAPYPSGAGGTVMKSELFIANRTVTNAQQWNAYFITQVSGNPQGGTGGAFVGETTLDTTAPSTLTCSVLDSAAGNTQTFNLWLVELL